MTLALITDPLVGQVLPWPARCDSMSRRGRTCVSDGEQQQRTLFTTAEAAAMLGVAHITVQDAIRRGALAHVAINPRLNMVTLEAIEEYRRERLGKRGGYRPGAGRRPTPAESTGDDNASAGRGEKEQ